MKQIQDNLLPHYHYQSVDKIGIRDVMSWGVKAVAVDIDNTICYDTTAKFIGGCEKWIKNIIQSGIPVVILSNATYLRAKKVADKLHIPFIALANKPATSGFYKIAEMLDLKMEEIAFIGDQIFADVIGANEAGGVSVLVEPTKTELSFYFFYKYRRFKERPVKKYIRTLEEKSGIPHKVKDFVKVEKKENEHQ